MPLISEAHSSRLRSTKSKTKPASLPTKTQPSSRRTAIRLTHFSGWTCAKEPMVLSVPAVPKERYYAVMLCDGNTYNYGYIGSRATGNEAGDYMVVGPDWEGEKPAGIKKAFTSTTPFTVAGYRSQLFNAGDMPNVVKVQAGFKAQPLSVFLKQRAPPPAPKIDFLPATTAGIQANYFQYLDAAIRFVPPAPEEKEIRAKLAKIGIGSDKP